MLLPDVAAGKRHERERQVVIYVIVTHLYSWSRAARSQKNLVGTEIFFFSWCTEEYLIPTVPHAQGSLLCGGTEIERPARLLGSRPLKASWKPGYAISHVASNLE